ncbi:MAG TPA: dihydrodipicolinate synthase family protein [Candidatus Limnocylindrales bacterium]|nr:dihydrodipicolinate synthase family protein [Candidatus Limnocylindrales bacterium]
MAAAFRLDGVFSVLPTAFDEDGRLDLAGTAALTRAHVQAGVAGLTALGVMGEAAELSEDERSSVLATVVAAAGTTPVVVGVTGATAEVVATRAQEAAGRGVAGVMVSPSASVSVGAAVAAAASAGLPVVIQDYPAGSGIRLSLDDLVEAVNGEPLVAGVKAESPPTSGTIEALRRRCPEIGAVGGLGGTFLIDELRAGATGVMTGLAVPEQLVAIVRTFATNPEAAERQWTELLPLVRLEAFPPFNLAARKEVWRLRGVIGSSRCRRAGARLDDRARDDIRRALDRIEVSIQGAAAAV